MDERFHPFQQAVEDWHWWYRTRRRILDQYLSRLNLDPARALLLDVGCGTGGGALVMSKHGRAIGVDRALESFRISMERPYTHRVVAEVDQLPFADAKFDAVCALDVLEHLDDDHRGAQELLRVLKPGGTAIVFVPAFQFLWRKNDDFPHHKRRYTKDSLRRVLVEAGLSVEEIGYFNLVLLLPQWIGTLVEKFSPQMIAKLEREEKPTRLNEVLGKAFSMELPLLKRGPLPLGASVVAIARRA